MDNKRKIIHVDMDAFFAAVEERDNPELRGKAIAVGGGSKRGVVCSASYKAREFGVRSAQPGFKAKRLCPELIFVKPRFDKYKEVSDQIREIFKQYTDLIEPLSFDEAYLDVTSNFMDINSATIIAEEIRQRIFQQTRCTASAGVSFNKFLAKTASDINKPNGLKEIRYEEVIPFLERLPVRKFYGIGKKTAEKMDRLNIQTGKDLKALDKIQMVQYFGKAGLFYYDIVRGLDKREVKAHRRRKSIGVERTFLDDLLDKEAILAKISIVVDMLWQILVKKNVFGRTLTLKIRFSDFKLISRSRSMSTEISEFDLLKNLVLELYNNVDQNHKSIRLIGVSVSNLNNEEPEEAQQLSLDFDDNPRTEEE